MQYNMREARNQLSKLVQAVLAGGNVVIARNGIPAARLVKIKGVSIAIVFQTQKLKGLGSK